MNNSVIIWNVSRSSSTRARASTRLKTGSWIGRSLMRNLLGQFDAHQRHIIGKVFVPLPSNCLGNGAGDHFRQRALAERTNRLFQPVSSPEFAVRVRHFIETVAQQV